MTTHLRARAAQAVGLLALVVGGIAVAPGIALAQAPKVHVNGVSPNNVLSGGQVTLQYTVTNTNGGLGGGGDNQPTSATITFNLPSGVKCGDCGQQADIQPGQSANFTAHLTMPQVQAGQTQQITVTVNAKIGNDSSSDQGHVTVQGPDKPQSVHAITGKVKDTAGKGISGAKVGAQDSSGKTFSATSNGSGSFSILSSDSNPIAPGNITVGAGKDGYGDNSVVNVTGEAGKTVNVTLVLKPSTASSSASASATPTASNPSLGPGSVLDTGGAAVPSVNVPTNGDAKNASQNSSSGSMLFVVLGGLLVAAGIGAIVLVLMRRKNAAKTTDGPGGGDPTAMGGGPGVVPPSQGRFNDATRVGGAPVAGLGNPAAATMVAPRSGAPSMSDAPTMLHRPVPAAAADDEFPDPYGAPLPQPGGYAGAPAGGWDDQYAAPNQYPQGGADNYAGTQPYGGGAQPAQPERFDEHTSLYQPESEQDGYGDYGHGGGTYGGQQYGGGGYQGGEDYASGGAYQGGGGYGQEQPEQGGYGSWGAPAGGIDSGSGYGPQGGQGSGQYGGGTYGGNGGGAANGGGTYGGAANGGGAGGGTYGGGQQYGGGYDDRGGYEQGYEQPGGAPQGGVPQGGAPQGGQYGGGQYGGGGNGRAPQQGGGYGYEQQPYDEDNGGYGGRRGYEDDDQQQPSRRGGGRRPGGY